MKSGNEQKFLESINHIDDRIVSDVLGKVDAKKKMAYRPRRRSFTAWAVSAAAVAACLMLIGISIPREPTVTVDSTNLLPHVKETNMTEEINTAPEYDGSRGLLYAVREDGKTAAFMGFGTCTDEVVYIASYYNGLPVVEMRNQPLYDSDYVIWDNYGSKYVKRIVVSDTVEKIWAYVLDICPNLESIYFGASVEYFKPLFFNGDYGKNFASVEVSPENPYYSDKGNCIVDLRTKELVLGTPTTIIPDDGSVAVIGFQAFAAARQNLTSIVIPEGVKIIDHGAFSTCDKLESVSLPDSLEVIELSAFESCRSLKTLELGTNLKAFNQTVFHKMYCPTLYYKGTVEQWEAVIKPSYSNVSISVPVICTDGQSLSNAGRQGVYNWIFLPEYEALWNQRYPDRPQPQYDPEYTGE